MALTVNGGPAFPVTDRQSAAGATYQGMSLRDWFAGQALVGMLSQAGAPPADGNIEELTTRAYKVADDMLKRRMITPD